MSQGGNPSAVSDNDAMKALIGDVVTKQAAKKKALDAAAAANKQPERKRPRREATISESLKPSEDYYGPGGTADSNDQEDSVDKTKPDFGLSGALSKDPSTGATNTYKGISLKFQEPPEARTPSTLWRFYVFKGEDQIDTLHVSRQSAYLWGRNEEIADISLQHPSCSTQHAVLQYRALNDKSTGKLLCQPYLMDLESTNGSFINGVQLDAARYYQLKRGDVLKFGASTREYVLLSANTTSIK